MPRLAAPAPVAPGGPQAVSFTLADRWLSTCGAGGADAIRTLQQCDRSTKPLPRPHSLAEKSEPVWGSSPTAEHTVFTHCRAHDSSGKESLVLSGVMVGKP